MSRYDVDIAYQGDVAMAVSEAKRVVRNHIFSYEAKLAEPPEQTTLSNVIDLIS